MLEPCRTTESSFLSTPHALKTIGHKNIGAEAIRQDLATLVVSGVTDVASKVASRMGSIYQNLLRLRT